MTAEKKITPVLKLTRTRTEEYEICPHCNKEIMEKSSYIDPDNYVYHRPCMDKGPIEKIIPCLPPGWGDGSAIASALEAIAGKTEPEADKPKKVSITREQWLKAGEKAGWLKEASSKVHYRASPVIHDTGVMQEPVNPLDEVDDRELKKTVLEVLSILPDG